MVDVTSVFKACLKAIQAQNRAMNLNEDPKTDIFRKNSQKNEIDFKAKKISASIRNLNEFLLKNRKNYANFSPYRESSNINYEQLDGQIEELISVCTKLIQQFQNELTLIQGSNELREHYKNLGIILSAFLKKTCREFYEQKSNRVKKSMEVFHLSKLESKQSTESTVAKKRYESYVEDENYQKPEIEFSIKEQQMFERENRCLLHELNSYSNEVKAVESKVVQIAELQQMLAEKVLEQDLDVERIATSVYDTNTDIHTGNEQIRNAIQRNAVLRVWILFFLLVMSLSILFLDWYND